MVLIIYSPKHNHPPIHLNLNDVGSSHDDSSHLFNIASSLAVPGNTKDTLINLINYGDNWSKKYNNIESNWTYR